MRNTAIIGGLGYIVIFITGIFANFFVLEELNVAGDNPATFDNIQSNTSLFIQALAAFVGMVIFDLVLTWALYKVFKEQNERLSRRAAWFRLINAALFGAALIFLFEVLNTVQTSPASPESIREVAFAVDMFSQVWLLGLLFFGIHLIMLAKLICQSKQVSKIIPALLTIAGIGYILDTMLQFFYTDYTAIADISVLVVVLPGIIGELALTVWLLVKGGSVNSSLQAY